jgi:acyl-CoA-binding protein
MKRLIISVISIIIFAQICFAQTNWSETAVKDLDYMYQMYRDNHAGGVDPENPGFNKKLEKEYKKAFKKALKAKTEYDYQKALISFLTPFRDGHMRVEFNHSIYPYNFKPIVNDTLRKPISWESFGNNNAWVYMNTFNGKNLIETYRKFMPELAKIKNKNIIVLDVRYNAGGNSMLGYLMLAKLYGDQFVESIIKKTHKNESSYFRATPWVVEQLKKLKTEFGYNSDWEVDKTKQAIKDGKNIVWLWSSESQDDTKASPAVADLKSKVYVLTDKHCFSACLDFMDIVKEIGGIVQVGQETGGDTKYVQLGEFALPSGNGLIKISYTGHSGRVRKDNETYKPDYKFKGDMSDTKAIQQWIINLDKKINKKRTKKL